MSAPLKNYRFVYRDYLGIKRVVGCQDITLSRALKKVPYLKVMRITKGFINDKDIPNAYLNKILAKIERWHDQEKSLGL